MVEIPEGMVPWVGGDRAPADWDGNRVLGDDGEYYEPYEDGGLDWTHGLSAQGIGSDIIAYTPVRDHRPYAQTNDTDRTPAIGIEQHVIAWQPVEESADVTQVRERCARIAENFTRAGRDWVPDSLWDNITKGIAAAIREEGGK